MSRPQRYKGRKRVTGTTSAPESPKALRARTRHSAYAPTVDDVERGDEDLPWHQRLGRRGWLAMLLLPICFLTTRAFLETTAYVGSDPNFWTGPEFWSFIGGFVIWLVWFWLFPRPVSIYVLGHELTHAVFTYLCGGHVTKFRAGGGGGYVHTTKTNILIALSPYFFPFYTLLLVAIAAITGHFIDYYTPHQIGSLALKPSWIFLALVGLTLSFHLTFTVWMISKEQPDLSENGNFFSLVLIYLINLLLIALLVVWGAPNVSVGDFFGQWWADARETFGFVWKAVAGIGLLFRELVA